MMMSWKLMYRSRSHRDPEETGYRDSVRAPDTDQRRMLHHMQQQFPTFKSRRQKLPSDRLEVASADGRNHPSRRDKVMSAARYPVTCIPGKMGHLPQKGTEGAGVDVSHTVQGRFPVRRIIRPEARVSTCRGRVVRRPCRSFPRRASHSSRSRRGRKHHDVIRSRGRETMTSRRKVNNRHPFR